ncbi:MAG: hypothetical protein P8M22_01335 [Phycisphaerales bacterium]|nr:hypothetical protein [Phycisphaerales bacterium]
MRTRYTIAMGWLLALSCTALVLNMGTARSHASSTDDLKSVLSLTNTFVAQSDFGQSFANQMNAKNSQADGVSSPGSSRLSSSRSSIDQYIEVAHEIDPRLGKLLMDSCSDGGQDPAELERMIRRYGRGLVALADLQATDPELYERKIQELHLDAETNTIALALRNVIEAQGPNCQEAIQLKASLEVIMRARLALSISNRERSLEQLNDRIATLKERLEYEETHFDAELDRQMRQMLRELDPVEAAKGR